jgi:hypothetical protein
MDRRISTVPIAGASRTRASSEAALESMPQPSQAYLDEVAKREAQPSTN